MGIAKKLLDFHSPHFLRTPCTVITSLSALLLAVLANPLVSLDQLETRALRRLLSFRRLVSPFALPGSFFSLSPLAWTSCSLGLWTSSSLFHSDF